MARCSVTRTCSAAVLAALLALAACSARRPAPGPGSWPTASGERAPIAGWIDPGICRPLPGPALDGADLVIALHETVAPDLAPLARTHAERVVFANLYETPIRLTCEGRLEPGLVERWEAAQGGRRWLLRLRAEARLWDGTPVTADLVLAAWRRSAALAAAAGRRSCSAWLAGPGATIRPTDDHGLAIDLAAPWPDLPVLLAHPDLAVAIERPGWLWPVGSGPCRLSSTSDLPLPDLACRPHPHHPDPPVWASLTFRILPGRDPRDLLSGDVDLVVLRDRAAAAYYAQSPGVRTAPLPWDRLHLLLASPHGPLRTVRGEDLPRADATVAESAVWTSPFLQKGPGGPCPPLAAPGSDPALPRDDPDPALVALQARHLVHPVGDPDARALAQRLAALLPGGLSARPAAGPALAWSLRQGLAAGHVVGLDAAAPGPGLGLATLLDQAPWLADAAAPLDDPLQAASRLQEAGLLVPLVATRARLVWRAPLAGLALTHDGLPLVGGLGPPAAPAALP